MTSTTVRAVLRATVLLAGLAGAVLLTNRIQGPDEAATDIGGGFLMLGALGLVAALWAARDARSGDDPLGATIALWLLTGVLVGAGLVAVDLVRHGAQPAGDLAVVGTFLLAVVAGPAIVAAALVSRPVTRPVTR